MSLISYFAGVVCGFGGAMIGILLSNWTRHGSDE